MNLPLVLLLQAILLSAPASANEVLNFCEGEGCSCFQAYRKATSDGRSTDFPIGTVRSFTLYEQMDKSSKKIGSFKMGILATPNAKKTVVRMRGEYIVERINKTGIPLALGQRVDTLFHMGEGYLQVRKEGKWIEFFEDDVVLKEKSKTVLDGWLEVSVGKLRGFTQDSPFESCLE